MLLELKVENFITIKSAHLIFEEGFTVFTGETGAGKSVLLKAIMLILGERGGANYLSPNAPSAEVEAVIYGGELLKERLSEIGLEPEEEIHVRRIITPNRQRIYVNGSPVSLAELSFLTSGLIELTSQHEFYSLFDRKNQLTLYDTLLGLSSLVEDYQRLFEKYKALNREIASFEERLRQSALRKDYLEFQLKEIEELNPNPEEEENLLSLRNKLRNLSALRDLALALQSTLESVYTPLKQALKLLDKLAGYESSFTERKSALEPLYYELKDLEREVSRFLADLPEDAQSLDEIEARLAKYERLKRKYQLDTEGLIKLKEEIKKELSTLETGEDELIKLKEERDKLLDELFSLAEEISLKRREKKGILEERLEDELSQLGMKGARLVFNLKTKGKLPENLTSFGLDELEILFQPNPGLPFKPLEKIASGGELSRIFLILKSLMSFAQPSTLIFDEVDAGVGGLIAQKVGEKLRALSEKHQVICITHLPQIAKLAHHHFLVEKVQDGAQTQTVIKRLSQEERVKELARMLGEPEELFFAKRLLKL
jgi:DNA repair protein RecN (Recombination protein N)